MDKKGKDFMNYLKKMIKFLSSDSDTQQQMYPKEILWNIADDVANEWDYEYFKVPIQNLIDSGDKYCVLYTDDSNPISNHVYEKIGYNKNI